MPPGKGRLLTHAAILCACMLTLVDRYIDIGNINTCFMIHRTCSAKACEESLPRLRSFCLRMPRVPRTHDSGLAAARAVSLSERYKQIERNVDRDFMRKISSDVIFMPFIQRLPFKNPPFHPSATRTAIFLCNQPEWLVCGLLTL